MGMTMDHPTTDSLIAAYLLDAVEPDEALAIEAHVLSCGECTATMVDLRTSVDRLASIVTPLTPPPLELRERILAAATVRRAPRRVEFEPAEVHLIESTRALSLLERLTPAQWATKVGPEFPDWNVQDLAAHLASSEALLAIQLGVEPLLPETEDQAEPRAHAAVARHRQLTPRQTLDELTTIYELEHHALLGLGPAVESMMVSLYGMEFSLAFALTQRSFEIWTHSDDIRQVLGLVSVPPPAPSLESMSSAVVETIPVMLAATGVDAEGRRARVVLTGPGGGAYDLDLGLELPSASTEPDVIIELDVLDFCRAIGDRLPPAETRHRVTGDATLAEGIVASLPALAVL
jgi:uncharacterized protein (TIGR03083 family)